MQSPNNRSSATRVVVADDHEWIRHILINVAQDTLPEAEVVGTEDGVQALEACQNGCDFLVSNHFMPNMDGMTLIRQVRQQIPRLPIVMVSVHPDAEADAMAAGADWFLTKEQIMEHLPKLLRQHVWNQSAEGSEELVSCQ